MGFSDVYRSVLKEYPDIMTALIDKVKVKIEG